MTMTINVSIHNSQKITSSFMEIGFRVLKHLTSSPDLDPGDFYLEIPQKTLF